jgi:hypothetical protein
MHSLDLDLLIAPLVSPKPFVACPIHTEDDDAQHEDGEHGDIQQCVNHGPPNVPLAENDPTLPRKIPFGSRH